MDPLKVVFTWLTPINISWMVRSHTPIKQVQNFQSSHFEWFNPVKFTVSSVKSAFLLVFSHASPIENNGETTSPSAAALETLNSAPAGWRCYALARRVQPRSSGNHPPEIPCLVVWNRPWEAGGKDFSKDSGSKYLVGGFNLTYSSFLNRESEK